MICLVQKSACSVEAGQGCAIMHQICIISNAQIVTNLTLIAAWGAH